MGDVYVEVRPDLPVLRTIPAGPEVRLDLGRENGREVLVGVEVLGAVTVRSEGVPLPGPAFARWLDREFDTAARRLAEAERNGRDETVAREQERVETLRDAHIQLGGTDDDVTTPADRGGAATPHPDSGTSETET